MVKASVVAALSALVLLACADASQSPPAASPVAPPAAAPITVAAPSTPPADPPPDPGATVAAPVAQDASAVALTTADAGAPTIPDEGVDPAYLACTTDSDCVSVERIGCCHNGRHVGVAVAQKEAYLQSFKCPEHHPKCPQYRLKHDDRVGACDAATHLCGLR